MNFDGYTEPEIQCWLWLRAIEWTGFPAYVSQIIAPILFIFYPWWQVVIGVILVGLAWCMVRYSFVSVTISNIACLAVVWFKWPVAIGSAIYLFTQHQFVASFVALIWPLIAGFTTPPGKVGNIELRLAECIGYVAPESVGSTDTPGNIPTVKTPAEAKKLPPGTIFRTPDGRILKVPKT